MRAPLRRRREVDEDERNPWALRPDPPWCGCAGCLPLVVDDGRRARTVVLASDSGAFVPPARRSLVVEPAVVRPVAERVVSPPTPVAAPRCCRCGEPRKLAARGLCWRCYAPPSRAHAGRAVALTLAGGR